MTLPLPEPTRTALRGQQVDNLFLLYYRYVSTWRRTVKGGTERWELKSEGADSPKRKALEAVRDRRPPCAEELLENVLARELARLDGLKGAGTHATVCPVYVTDARLVAGLGYDGPLETGLSLHPLYGVPYLPGSSVKGVVRAWAEDVERTDEDTLRRVFGSSDKYHPQPEAQRLGVVTFHDAFPVEWPELQVDVLTPHFGDWYTRQATPGDWHNPVPTYFLTVAPGQRFRFGLSIPRSDEYDAVSMLAEVRGWLKDALEGLGAGAKTAAGYGYFTDPEAAEREAKEREEAEAREAERKRLALMAQGYGTGTVTIVKVMEERGKLQPDAEGQQALPFRTDDAEGVNKGNRVSFKAIERDGQRWAVEVRKLEG